MEGAETEMKPDLAVEIHRAAFPACCMDASTVAVHRWLNCRSRPCPSAHFIHNVTVAYDNTKNCERSVGPFIARNRVGSIAGWFLVDCNLSTLLTKRLTFVENYNVKARKLVSC